MKNIKKLLDIMSLLRDPNKGCPWDLKQSYQSIVPHTLEEAYEVAAAIESEDYDELCDELGDLLFQIVFYAQLASEESRFNFSDVVAAISEKLIRRHPHVFADKEFSSAEAQSAHWEASKEQERATKAVSSLTSTKTSSTYYSQLDGIAKSLPALSLARKLQSRAARVGFDWPSEQGVFAKLEEETQEVKDAWSDDQARMEEIGDLLFTCVNLSRHAEVDPEQALRLANKKFEQRFRTMELLSEKAGDDLNKRSPQQWQDQWQQAKLATQRTKK